MRVRPGRVAIQRSDKIRGSRMAGREGVREKKRKK